MDVREPVLNERSIPHLVSRLTSDAREVAQAEIALAKAKAGHALTRYKWATIYFAIAGVLALAALIALLVGLIMSLATLIGPGWATLVVVGVVLLIAGGIAMAGRSQLAAGPGR